MLPPHDSAIDQFQRELAARSAAVFAAHPRILLDHRREHPWLTGALGDPFAPVWFVAENPSLTQVERVVDRTSNGQWAASRGDRLLREMLVRHGFKVGSALSPGGWRCYITDVAKSADRADEWNRLPTASRAAVVRAWAPVLRWELEVGKPTLVVALGKRVNGWLDRLQRLGLLPRIPARTCIEHYSYVAMRPQGSLGPMHPERVARYDAQFEEIARRARVGG